MASPGGHSSGALCARLEIRLGTETSLYYSAELIMFSEENKHVIKFRRFLEEEVLVEDAEEELEKYWKVSSLSLVSLITPALKTEKITFQDTFCSLCDVDYGERNLLGRMMHVTSERHLMKVFMSFLLVSR